MIGLFGKQPTLPPAALALEALLLHDEIAFVDAVRALDATTRRRWLQDGAGVAWCKAAKTHDRVEALVVLHALAAHDDLLEHLPAWGRSRAHVGAEGWRRGKPMMALLHVGAGGASVRHYQRRFKDATGWQKLVEERCISPQAYTAQFGVSLPALRQWYDRGVLSSEGFAALLRADAAAVMHAVAAGEIQTADILQRCVTTDEAAGWARRFLHGGLAPCPIWMERRATERALASDLALQGRLSVDAFLQCVPRPDAQTMQALRHAGHATPWHALQAGLLEESEIERMVLSGEAPTAIVRGGWVPPTLVVRWVEQGRLDKQHFVDTSLAHWRPADPMPPYHYEAAVEAWGPYTLLRRLPLPRARDARVAYVARQLSTHLWHRASALSPQVTAPPAPLSAAAAAAADVCGICLERFDTNVEAAALLACEHPPVMCRGCLIAYVEKSDAAYPACVASDCKKPILPEDVVRAGGGAKLAHHLARDAIRRQLGHSAVWWACPTRGCVGGTLLGLEVGSNHQCRVCDQVALVRPPEVDWRRDAGKILRLIAGLLPGDDPTEARIRECPKCGVPTEHNGGCAHMTCRECSASWNFSLGLSNAYAPQGAGDEQTYVPQAGLLVMAGLYEGIAPGPGLHEAVVANAKRLQLMPSTAMLVTQALRGDALN